MTELRVSEAATVQFPMVKHAEEIGWTALSPEVAKQKRGGEAGMILRDELESKLAEFNPWLTADAARSIIETLDTLSVRQRRLLFDCYFEALLLHSKRRRLIPMIPEFAAEYLRTLDSLS